MTIGSRATTDQPMSFGEKPRRSRLPLVVVVLLVVAVGGGFAIWSAGVVGDPPVIDIVAPSAVGQRADVVVTVREPRRGLVDVVIEGSGAGLGATMLGEEHHAAPGRPWQAPESTETKLTVVVGKVIQPALTEGTLTIKVTATTAGSWWSKPSPVVVERALTVKLTPPTVTPMSSFVHVAQGGAEAIVYEVGPTSTRDGVVVDRADGTSPPWVFVGSLLPGGPPSRHFVLFALPYDDAGPEADVRGRVKLFAEDDVGNRTTSPFIHKYIPRPMPKDTFSGQGHRRNLRPDSPVHPLGGLAGGLSRAQPRVAQKEQRVPRRTRPAQRPEVSVVKDVSAL